MNLSIANKITQSVFAYIVTAIVKGRTVFRLCIINGNTTEDDVINTVQKLDEIAIEYTADKENEYC